MYNAVIVLGAGYNQIQYLKELRKFKLKIICIDKDKKKEGFYYADTIKKECQISLKKKGKINKKKWTSNYDVPIYNIKLSKPKKNTNNL